MSAPTNPMPINLVLHICCGPCALEPLRLLKEQYPDARVQGFFFNPNIAPEEEWCKRREAVAKVVQKENISVQYEGRDAQWYEAQVADIPKGPSRCRACLSLRLEKTADHTAACGYTHFTTTLLVSPFQLHEDIKEIASCIALRKGLRFLYQDFRPHFRQGQKRAREWGLYMQKHCGCGK